MAEYAEYALGQSLKNGLSHNPNYVPRKRPRTDCPHCGKSVEATEGLRMHITAKHPEVQHG